MLWTVHVSLVLCASCMCLGLSISELTATERYARTAILNGKEDDVIYALFWNYNDTHVTFEVNVKTTGWVGFGFSANGNMFPADVVIGWVKSDGTLHFSDRHTTGYEAPVRDVSQDWHVLYGSEHESRTVLKFVRKIDTCDGKEDDPIPQGTSHIIYAFGTSDPTFDDVISYNDIHVARGTKSLSIRAHVSVPVNLPSDVIMVDFKNHNIPIPEQSTTYWCQGIQMSDITGKYHVVKFEPVITPGNEKYVHHLVLYRCDDIHVDPEISDGVFGNCYDDRPANIPKCYTVMINIGVGTEPFIFPAKAGLLIEGPSFFILETHINNPNLVTGLTDSSALRLYLTPTLRPHDIALMGLGVIVGKGLDPVIPPHQEEYIVKGYCSEQCIEEGLAVSDLPEIKIFGVWPHLHQLGTSLTMRHIRHGEELQPVIQDAVYDFDYQSFYVLPEERVVYPGDSFRIDCLYDSTERSTVTFGGYSSSEEMCNVYMYYYPRLPLMNCLSRNTYDKLNWRDDLRDHLVSTNWSDGTFITNFKQMVQESEVVHTCGPGKLTSHTITFVETDDQTPYTPPESACP